LSAMKIFCEHHLRTQRAPVRRLQLDWLKIAAIRYAFFANLNTSMIHRRCAGDTLEQMAKHFQLQPATTSQVGRRDMRTRLYIFGLYRYKSPKGYGFSAVLVINRISILAILVINRVWFLHSSLDMGVFLRRSHFFSIIEKKTNKSPS